MRRDVGLRYRRNSAGAFSVLLIVKDMWMVPYTSTCASAAAGAANAPATASDNSFFCIRMLLSFGLDRRSAEPGSRQPLR